MNTNILIPLFLIILLIIYYINYNHVIIINENFNNINDNDNFINIDKLDKDKVLKDYQHIIDDLKINNPALYYNSQVYLDSIKPFDKPKNIIISNSDGQFNIHTPKIKHYWAK